MRHLINIVESANSTLMESEIPPTTWGYWITDKGEIIPVDTHRHDKVSREYMVKHKGEGFNVQGATSMIALAEGWIWIKAVPNEDFAINFKRGKPTQRALSALSRLARSAHYTEFYFYCDRLDHQQEFVDASAFIRAVYFSNETILTEDRQKGKSLYDQGQSYVVIYRAMSAKTMQFNSMDYVTLSRKFAIEHAEHMAVVEGEPYHVVRAMVSGKDVYDAYNPGEYFYDGPVISGKIIHVANAD